MNNPKENSVAKENEPQLVGKELHAHLSGSIAPFSIFDIIVENDLYKQKDRLNSTTSSFGIMLADEIEADPQKAKQRFCDAYICRPNGTNRFSEVMQRFNLTSFLLQFPTIRSQVAKAACKDFQNSGVNYVEWRIDPFSSTIKETAQEGYEKLSDFYSGMRSIDLVSKLVLSLQRSRYRKTDGTPNQTKIAFLAQELEQLFRLGKDLPIVGVDFSGDEVVSLTHFNEIFDLARTKGLEIVPHVGEGGSPIEEGFSDIETALDAGAKRLGHAIVAYDNLSKYLGGNDRVGNLYDHQRIEKLKARQKAIIERVKKEKVAIEVCPTSNLTAHFGLRSFEDHPIGRLIQEGVPFAICSDDPGIFGTSLRQEIIGISKANNLDPQKLIETANHFGYDT